MSTIDVQARGHSYLFIHGAGGTKNKWRSIAPFFAEQSQDFFFIDLPGHGENPFPPAQSIKDYAVQLNREYGERNLIVVGHSMGGLIALEMAKQNPKVQGIILITSHFQMPVHPQIISSLQEGVFPESLFRASYSPHSDEALMNEERRELSLNPINITASDFIHCTEYQQGEDSLSLLAIPILALYGSEDRLLPPHALENLQALYPRLQSTIIEGSGHYLMLEKPEEVAQEILRFTLKNPI